MHVFALSAIALKTDPSRRDGMIVAPECLSARPAMPLLRRHVPRIPSHRTLTGRPLFGRRTRQGYGDAAMRRKGEPRTPTRPFAVPSLRQSRPPITFHQSLLTSHASPCATPRTVHDVDSNPYVFEAGSLHYACTQRTIYLRILTLDLFNSHE